MKSRRIIVVSALAIAASTAAFAARSRDGNEADEAVAYEQVKMTLADAIGLAERQTGGKAVEAKLEQEHGKWKGPRGRALLKSAYAYALYEHGLGYIYQHGDQIVWHCTLKHFSEWYPEKTQNRTIAPYDFLYGIASRHGLTPLLNREVTHTAAISLPFVA